VATRVAPYAAVAAGNLYAYQSARDMADNVQIALETRAVIDTNRKIRDVAVHLVAWASSRRADPATPNSPLPHSAPAGDPPEPKRTRYHLSSRRDLPGSRGGQAPPLHRHGAAEPPPPPRQEPGPDLRAVALCLLASLRAAHRNGGGPRRQPVARRSVAPRLDCGRRGRARLSARIAWGNLSAPG
jgi:hypothetical protein